ncbi:AP2-associated protein kinase 1-like [Megalobrama amblycephala]|uniref:AP2-associated protein kinase 1-like n=1 Tax=Megalobrama amblycephala TaxID=75352 RepID=UPI0020140ED9|nr:AP2-associated protein kinase 1-like [Megalobrama amblycephala]
MDPARSSDLQEYLSRNAQRMDQQDEQVMATARTVQTLVAQVAELSTQVLHLSSPTAPAPPPVPHSSTSTPQEPRIPAPERKPVARLEELDAAGVSGEHTVGPPFDHEPMQVGRARLSREERTHRKEKGLPSERQGPAVGPRLLSGGLALDKSSSATLLPSGASHLPGPGRLGRGRKHNGL